MMHVIENGVVIARPLLKAVLAFASKDTTRKSLCQLLVDPARGRVCTTDGCALAIVRCAPLVCPTPDDEPKPFGVEAEWLSGNLTAGRDMIEVSKRSETEVSVRYAKRSAPEMFYDAGSSLLVKDLFPPVDQVVPKWRTKSESRLVSVGLNMAYVRRVHDLQKAVGAIGVKVQFAPGKPDLDPVSFLAEKDGVQALAVVMPMRI